MLGLGALLAWIFLWEPREPEQPPGQIRSVFLLSNTGAESLREARAEVLLAAGPCTPDSVRGPEGGDDNRNRHLDPGETWSYSCTFEQPAPGEGDVDSQLELRLEIGAEPCPECVVCPECVECPECAPGLMVVKAPAAPTVQHGGEVSLVFWASSSGTGGIRIDSLSDEQCRPGTLVGPDGSTAVDPNNDGDGLLEPGETWRYECRYAETTDHREDEPDPKQLSAASVTGRDQSGRPVRATSNRPWLRILHGPKPDLEVEKCLPKWIVPGAPVSPVFRVSNVSTEAASYEEIALADEQCQADSLSGPESGDLHADLILDPGETWEYRCRDRRAATGSGATSAAVLTGRRVGTGVSTRVLSGSPPLTRREPEWIDFERLAAGCYARGRGPNPPALRVEVDGGGADLLITAENPWLGPSLNAATLFDSDCGDGDSSSQECPSCSECGEPGDRSLCLGRTTPFDWDLCTPNRVAGGRGRGSAAAAASNTLSLGNLLIVGEDLCDVAPADGRIDSPNDEGLAVVRMAIDFSEVLALPDVESVRLLGMTIVDNDEGAGRLVLEPAAGDAATGCKLPGTANNGVVRIRLGAKDDADACELLGGEAVPTTDVSLRTLPGGSREEVLDNAGVSGVKRVVIDDWRSGGIDDLVFLRETAELVCQSASG